MKKELRNFQIAKNVYLKNKHKVSRMSISSQYILEERLMRNKTRLSISNDLGISIKRIDYILSIELNKLILNV